MIVRPQMGLGNQLDLALQYTHEGTKVQESQAILSKFWNEIAMYFPDCGLSNHLLLSLSPLQKFEYVQDNY